MTLILPMAGKSSRYPNMKPKWMLSHPNGKHMAIQSIAGLDMSNIDRVVFVCLKQHEEQHHFTKGFTEELDKMGIKNYTICPLEKETKDSTETVCNAIRLLNLKGPIFIKDPDVFFSCAKVPVGNFVFYTNLNNFKLIDPCSKSYIDIDENNVITNIVEKKVISQNFCVGGYLFDSAEEFLQIADKLDCIMYRYISDVIYSGILHRQLVFKGVEIFDCEDWGTLADWRAYQKKFATLFVDIDGVIVENESTHFPPYIGEATPLWENVECLKSFCCTNKVEIVFTTSRPEDVRAETEAELKKMGFKYKALIMGLQHCKRIIINDYSPTNPYKSCDSINIKRDSVDLSELLNGILS